MEINTKTVFALFLASLLSGCYVILDDAGHDSYDTYYGSVPQIDTNSTYWYCENYYESGHGGGWSNYWEFYTIAFDEDGHDDIWAVEYRAYYYDGYLAVWGDLYSDHVLDAQTEEYFTMYTSHYDDFSCNDIYEVEFYVEDWNGNYTSYWLY